MKVRGDGGIKLILYASLGVSSIAFFRTLFKRIPLFNGLIQSTVWAVRTSKSLRALTAGAFIFSILSRYITRRSSQSTLLSFRYFFIYCWGLYYYFKIREFPVVRFQRTFFNTYIVEKSQLSKMSFAPTFWAFNRHAQTGVLFALSHIEWLFHTDLHWQREEIQSMDTFTWKNPTTGVVEQNMLHLDWAIWRDDNENMSEGPAGDGYRSTGTPIVILVHGLGDDINHPYVRRAARALHRVGWQCCCFSYWRADWYDPTDLITVVNHISNKNSTSPLCAIAWSAGGHMLVRMLQEVGKNTPLVAAISVSGCYDLPKVIDNISANENPTYRLFLSQQLKVCINRHMDNDLKFTKHLLSRTFISAFVFEKFGKPMEMYDRFQYCLHQDPSGKNWRKNWFINSKHFVSTSSKMREIQVTLLILHADDDPIVHGRQMNWNSLLHNKHIICMHTKRGGHVAHFDQILPLGDAYSDRVIVSFVSAVLESHSYTRFLVNVVR
jgi:predicted alpha/beta-fold hydrolase